MHWTSEKCVSLLCLFTNNHVAGGGVGWRGGGVQLTIISYLFFFGGDSIMKLLHIEKLL